jgi:potassium/hydrogen antiporter
MESITVVNVAVLLCALLITIGIASSLIAAKFGAPLLLVFLTVGMLAGQEGIGGLEFADYRLAYFIGSVSLAIILFDGGLRTRFSTFQGALGPAGILATLGVVITAVITGLAASYLLEIPLLSGLLIGAVVSSTDAAAVFFLMRSRGLQLRGKVGSIIEIESGTNDPVAVLMSIVLAGLLLEGKTHPDASALVLLGQQAVFGTLAGACGGWAIVKVLNRVAWPNGLHALFVLAAALLIYGVAALLNGSGFLAVYLAGLIVGNRPVRAFAAILSFHDAATWLCQIAMFILLGLLVMPSTLLQFTLPAVGVAAFLMLVGRPVAVWLCLVPFPFGAKEKLFIAWVGLRGAVSIFLASIPILAGVAGAEIYFNIAFFVVLMSLLVQGWSIARVAEKLGLALPMGAPDPQRVEIDIPGQGDLDMVGYPILDQSPVLQRTALPDGTHSVLVMRDGEILTPEAAGSLKPGDYGYFLAPRDRLGRLDSLFTGYRSTRGKAWLLGFLKLLRRRPRPGVLRPRSGTAVASSDERDDIRT